MASGAEFPFNNAISRRTLLVGCGAVALNISMARLAVAAEPGTDLPDALMRRALAALERHRPHLAAFDRIGIADFTVASRYPRFHIVELVSGGSDALLVAHGRGSDPDHKGWLERFSNTPGSAASSSGAYVTAEGYEGQHGPSRRLVGLDPENSNVERRGIVIHAADYVSAEFASAHGKLGRSEGCFAFAHADLDTVLRKLGPGRLIFADKLPVWKPAIGRIA